MRKLGNRFLLLADHSLDLTPSLRNRRTQRDELRSSWSFLTAPPRSIFQLSRLKSAGLQLHPRLSASSSVLTNSSCVSAYLRPSSSIRFPISSRVINLFI